MTIKIIKQESGIWVPRVGGVRSGSQRRFAFEQRPERSEGPAVLGERLYWAEEKVQRVPGFF